MIYQSNVTDRQLFSNAYAAISNAKVSQTALQNAVLTQNYLRLIQPIVTGQQIINFPILTNQTNSGNATRNDEVRLAQQDAFFVGQLAFTIFKSATFNIVPNTYPNAVTYTNAANYYDLYDGRLNITIDNSVVTKNYSMRKFLNIPATQLTAATNSPQDQFNGVDMLPFEPNVVFVGTAGVEISVILPGPMGTLDANSFACFDFFGILAQNVALGAVQ